MKQIRHILADQNGAYFLMSALVLSIMVGFAALGVEVGRWYAIQAEISKSVDGAAFAAAKNVSNPLFPDDASLEAFAVLVAQANYPGNILESDTPVFTASLDAQRQVTVNATVNSLNSLTTVFDTGTATTALGSVGAAQLRRAEIALVLDVSGSMDGQPLADLQTGATLFVNNFQSFQKDHKFALLKFATGVETPFPLDTDFVFDITGDIDDLTAPGFGFTNTEDALGQAVNIDWEPDQLLVPLNQRTQQAVVLFSDGNPTAFRGTFGHDGDQNIDGVAIKNGGVTTIPGYIGDPDQQAVWLTTIFPGRHGDGKTVGSSLCPPVTGPDETTKWYIFQDPTYGISTYGSPMSGYSYEDCFVQQADFDDYMEWLVRQMAIDHAAELKALGIVVYTIGLGAVDEVFMQTLATDPDHAYMAPTSADLSGIFQTIANELKLILVS